MEGGLSDSRVRRWFPWAYLEQKVRWFTTAVAFVRCGGRSTSTAKGDMGSVASGVPEMQWTHSQVVGRREVPRIQYAAVYGKVQGCGGLCRAIRSCHKWRGRYARGLFTRDAYVGN